LCLIEEEEWWDLEAECLCLSEEEDLWEWEEGEELHVEVRARAPRGISPWPCWLAGKELAGGEGTRASAGDAPRG
jgi:hypothetical protein